MSNVETHVLSGSAASGQKCCRLSCGSCRPTSHCYVLMDHRLWTECGGSGTLGSELAPLVIFGLASVLYDSDCARAQTLNGTNCLANIRTERIVCHSIILVGMIIVVSTKLNCGLVNQPIDLCAIGPANCPADIVGNCNLNCGLVNQPIVLCAIGPTNSPRDILLEVPS